MSQHPAKSAGGRIDPLAWPGRTAVVLTGRIKDNAARARERRRNSGSAKNSRRVDFVGVFDAEIFMSGMHGGHGGGKTSSLKAPMKPKLIVLITGESGAGKDYYADVYVFVFNNRSFEAHAVSINEATEHEYAAVIGAEVNRQNCTYKEQHRLALTAVF